MLSLSSFPPFPFWLHNTTPSFLSQWVLFVTFYSYQIQVSTQARAKVKEKKERMVDGSMVAPFLLFFSFSFSLSLSLFPDIGWLVCYLVVDKDKGRAEQLYRRMKCLFSFFLLDWFGTESIGYHMAICMVCVGSGEYIAINIVIIQCLRLNIKRELRTMDGMGTGRWGVFIERVWCGGEWTRA